MTAIDRYIIITMVYRHMYYASPRQWTVNIPLTLREYTHITRGDTVKKMQLTDQMIFK